MAITAKDVNKLRQMTGAGMMDCKKALVEAEGDFEKAIELLRKKGQKVSASRADRETSEGSVFVKTSDDNSAAVLVALNCETDFVGKNEEFLNLGNAIAQLAFDNKTADKEALLSLQLDGAPVSEKITEMVGKIGEKIEVSQLIVEEGEAIVPYIHAGNKLGVLVSLKNTNGVDVSAAGKDVGMQIAAMNPIAVNKDEVPQDIVAKEFEIGKEQAIAEGKPENIIEKIAQGKLNKYFKENTLLEQSFVKDSGVTVGKYLDSISKGLTVDAFKRVSIG